MNKLILSLSVIAGSIVQQAARQLAKLFKFLSTHLISFVQRVAREPLPRQLLGTLEPSMVALRLLPAGEGTSNRLASDSSEFIVGWKSEARSDVFIAMGVGL